MTMPPTPPRGTDAIQALRELLAGLDPDCELQVDAASGEMLVRGNIDPAELDAAIKASGLGLRIAGSGGGGCGGGGCGCA